jgi:hypothetical protein
VNEGTFALLKRSYLEIVDDLLTAIVGGVVNEPIPYDIKLNFYPLAEPAQSVRSVKGSLPNAAPTDPLYTFLPTIDFVFDPGQNGIAWQGAKTPEDGSTFYVDYARKNSTSPLTDINVGGVTRTLCEAIGREITTVYQEIQFAYFSGFIDTATGQSLDYVVSILGITRMTSEFATGIATFFRDPTAEAGSITIPVGTLLTTTKGDVVFQTIEERTLQQGQARADVPIRADQDFGGDKGLVGAGAITVVSQSISGINRVTNFDPTTRAAKDESDDDLRLRAKAALRALGKATIAALEKVITDDRAQLQEISDPNNLNGNASLPGTVTLLVKTDAGRFPSLQADVNQTRAAGVLTTLIAPFVYVKLRINTKITSGLTGAGQDKIKTDVITALQAYTDGLGSGSPAIGDALLGAVKAVKDVSDAVIKEAFTWRADVGQPGTDPLVDLIVESLAGVSTTDTSAVRLAVKDVIDNQAPALLPSGNRIPDNTLIKKPDGTPASDGDVEAGKFQVSPPSGFSVVLDMEPSDIALQVG